jgi:hypothetical protein
MKKLFNSNQNQKEYEKAYQEYLIDSNEEKKKSMAEFLELTEMESRESKLLGENSWNVNKNGILTISLNGKEISLTESQWNALKNQVSFINELEIKDVDKHKSSKFLK